VKEKRFVRLAAPPILMAVGCRIMGKPSLKVRLTDYSLITFLAIPGH